MSRMQEIRVAHTEGAHELLATKADGPVVQEGLRQGDIQSYEVVSSNRRCTSNPRIWRTHHYNRTSDQQVANEFIQSCP